MSTQERSASYPSERSINERDEAAWRRARGRAAAQRDFYVHLVTYVVVGAFLVFIDVATGSETDTIVGLDWAYWPLGGWAVGVVLHAFLVFGTVAGWEERRAIELYEKDQSWTPPRS